MPNRKIPAMRNIIPINLGKTAYKISDIPIHRGISYVSIIGIIHLYFYANPPIVVEIIPKPRYLFCHLKDVWAVPKAIKKMDVAKASS